MRKCVNCLKEINEKEAFCLTCHEEVLECAKNRIADLEAKLAEKQKENATLEAMLAENANDRKTMQEFKIGEDEYDLTDEDARNSLCWEVEELKQQLAKKETLLKKYVSTSCPIKQDKISFALEHLEQIRKEFEIKFKGCKWKDEMLVGKFCNITNEIIDNQINELKEMK